MWETVKGVLDVVNTEKGKQLKSEQAKTQIAIEKTFQKEEEELLVEALCEYEVGSM